MQNHRGASSRRCRFRFGRLCPTRRNATGRTLRRSHRFLYRGRGYPVFHLTAITHRRDGIYPTTIVGPPPMEDFYMGDATVRIFLPVFKMNFPELVDMTLPPEGVFHNLVFVSIRKQYPYQAFKVMHGLWGMGQMMFSKYIVVVDEDCDVHN